MKKITILSLVVFHLFMVKSNGQTIIEQKGIIEKVIDNATGKTIPMDTIRKMIEKNHNLNLQPVINEYGDVGHYIYYEKAMPNIGETDLRVKIGELFPPFVMKPVDNDSIYSSKLLGKIVMIDFWLMITKKTPLSRFEDFITASSLNKDVIPLIVCQSSEEEAKEFMDSTKIKIPIVADAFNFLRRYHITQVPIYVIIDKTGKLVGYFDEFKNVKIALMNLKN